MRCIYIYMSAICDATMYTHTGIQSNQLFQCVGLQQCLMIAVAHMLISDRFDSVFVIFTLTSYVHNCFVFVSQVCMGLEKRLQQLSSTSHNKAAQSVTTATASAKITASHPHDTDTSQIDRASQVCSSCCTLKFFLQTSQLLFLMA
jgi:hypothetical protein